MEKRMQYRMLREFYSIDQFQMRTRGEGVKKSENFADIISGSSPRSRHILDFLREGGDKGTPQYEDHVNSKVRERFQRAEGKERRARGNAAAPRRRKKEDIEASGFYKRDEYRPPKRKVLDRSSVLLSIL